jgi:hypothetical protein
MAFDALKQALEALDEPASCTGAVRLAEPVVIQLPEGELGPTTDPAFLDWLVSHAEPAPFGYANQTRHDPTVRRALRLVARGEARINGFDPALVIPEIERTLSPQTRLAATLTDVLVYPPYGHFARHKDTPRSPDLVGTLIVGLPVAHEGGAFRIEDDPEPRVVDWSGPVEEPTVLRWIAMFTDVGHAVEPVTAGARVTLVYALTRAEPAGPDQTGFERLGGLRRAARDLELPSDGPLMIACTRQVIAPDGPQPQGIETLRGTDRLVAEVLASEGLSVAVRTCVAARYRDGDRGLPPSRVPDLHGEGEVFLARLARALRDRDVAELLDAVVFGPSPGGDGGGFSDENASSLAPFIVDRIPIESWIFRARAAATFLREIYFSDYDFVGNDAVEAYLYKLAALEVTRR